jgi:hypothetical protein
MRHELSGPFRLTFAAIFLGPLVALVSCVATLPTVKYYHAATGRRLAVKADGRVDLSSLSGLSGGGGGSSQAIGIITQVISSGCSSTSTAGILDGNGGFTSLLSGLIPPELTQSGVTAPPTSVDFCKTLLSPADAQRLQILFQYFGGEILLDGIHNLDTCPILAWNAKVYKPYMAGTLTAAQYAKGMLGFLANKCVQNLNGKQSACAAALALAGLPVPSGYVSLP